LLTISLGFKEIIQRDYPKTLHVRWKKVLKQRDVVVVKESSRSFTQPDFEFAIFGRY